MHCLLPSAACRRLLPVAAVLAALLLLALPYSYQACASVKQQPRELAVLNLHCSSNWDLGAAVGIATQPLIRDRYAASAALHRCLDYVCTPEGRRTLGQMLDLHQRKYPRLVDELKGLAAGADVPFEQVLISNMREELLSVAAPTTKRREYSCTDVLLSKHHQQSVHQGLQRDLQLQKRQQQQRLSLIGHNEDMTRDTDGKVYFVKYTNTTLHTTTSSSSSRQSQHSLPAYLHHTHFPEPELRHHAKLFTWLGFVYGGELASSAFGFNSAGVGFTLNAVFPASPAMPGVSRNFVSRELLEARSIQQALDVISRPGQAIGHSYNLFDLHTKRMFNIEVGPGSVTSVLEVGNSQSLRGTASWYFHANMYKHLLVEQQFDNSSFHREVRALQLQAPRSASDIVSILGDVADPDYPIYRRGNSAADSDVITLCTAMIDLDKAVLEVYTGNPADQKARKLQLRFDLQDLQLLPLTAA